MHVGDRDGIDAELTIRPLHVHEVANEWKPFQCWFLEPTIVIHGATKTSFLFHRTRLLQKRYEIPKVTIQEEMVSERTLVSKAKHLAQAVSTSWLRTASSETQHHGCGESLVRLSKNNCKALFKATYSGEKISPLSSMIPAQWSPSFIF